MGYKSAANRIVSMKYAKRCGLAGRDYNKPWLTKNEKIIKKNIVIAGLTGYKSFGPMGDVAGAFSIC